MGYDNAAPGRLPFPAFCRDRRTYTNKKKTAIPSKQSGAGRVTALTKAFPARLASGEYRLRVTRMRIARGISEVDKTPAVPSRSAIHAVEPPSAHNIAQAGTARRRSFASYERWYVTSMESAAAETSADKAFWRDRENRITAINQPSNRSPQTP